MQSLRSIARLLTPVPLVDNIWQYQHRAARVRQISTVGG